MYHLYHSPHLLVIARKLSELLEKNKPADPLKPVEIIVSNRDTAQWLSLFLADQYGISANINYRLPSEWLWLRIRDRHPELPNILPSDPGPVSWSLYHLLCDTSVLDKLPILKNWIQGKSGSPELHTWQLSCQISSVFDQYQMYRPEMMKEWRESRSRNIDNWQIELWKILTDFWKVLSGNDLESDRSLLFSELIEAGISNETFSDQPIYLFNPGLIPPPLSNLLLKSSDSFEVFHFMIQSSQSGSLDYRIRNSLYYEFCHEQMELIHPISEYAKKNQNQVSITGLNAELTAINNLGRIQQSIVQNEKLPVLDSDDGSVQVRSCHSRLREVEVLHHFLLGLFSDDDLLTPEDILVVTTDLELYAPFIEAVFGTMEEGLPGIPYHIAVNTNSINRVIVAIGHLFELVDSRFKKDEILEFIRHSAIRDNFQLSDSDLSVIRKWFDENRVVWGFDGNHRSEFGQPADEQQTWKQAMRRGWFGQLITDMPGILMNDTLLYTGIVSADEKDLWAKTDQILRLLYRVSIICKNDYTPDQWSEIIESWIQELISSNPEYEDEVRSVLNACQRTISEMKTGGIEGPVSFKIFSSSFRKNLDKKRSGTASLTRGMIFSSMVPVRSLPFPVIVLMGLNDDQFPRKPSAPGYDLMASDRRPGERDRKSEDKNLFLESILAAGKIHYSSYIGRNQEDDEILPPSPVLDEWIQALATCHKIDSGQIIQTENLNGFSANQFVNGNEKSFSEIYQRLVKKQLKGSNLKGILVDKTIDFENEADQRIIGIGDLTGFFSNPAGSFFRQRMNIYLKNQAEDDEEFELDGLLTHIIFQYVFSWKLQGMRNEEILELLLASGHLPQGWPGEKLALNTIDLVETTLTMLHENGFNPKPVSQRVSLQIKDLFIEGVIPSYSQTGQLDIYLSGDSGKRMMKSWINHLIMCVNLKDPDFKSTLLFGVKKGAFDWKCFPFIPDAEEILMQLTALYTEGMQAPTNLYLNSAYQYALHVNNNESSAKYHARKEWEGSFKNFSENSDNYIELILGKESEADINEISKIAEFLFKPIVDSVEDWR
jgi:exodeoxyribonuclease V gamma subunit